MIRVGGAGAFACRRFAIGLNDHWTKCATQKTQHPSCKAAMKTSLASLVFAGMSIAAYPQATDLGRAVQLYSVAEAYEVYSAILPEEWTWCYAHSKILLIGAETVSYRMCPWFRDTRPTIVLQTKTTMTVCEN